MDGPTDPNALESDPEQGLDDEKARKAGFSLAAEAYEKDHFTPRSFLAYFAFLWAFAVGFLGVILVTRKVLDPSLEPIPVGVLIIRSFGIIAVFSFAYTLLKFGERLLLPIHATISIELTKARAKGKENPVEIKELTNTVNSLSKEFREYVKKAD